MAIIAPKVENYTTYKTSRGRSLHCGDEVAVALQGATTDEVKDLAKRLGVEDLEKYNGLNPGQIRMILGSKIRKAVKSAETSIDWDKAVAALRKAVDAREGQALKEKDIKARETAAKAEAKAKSKSKAKAA